MRQFTRAAVDLPTLRDDGPGGRAAKRHRAARNTDPQSELDFVAHWNQPDVRGALHAIQGWVCAYCQGDISRDGGDIDHFRPKNGSAEAGHSGYWWLAYRFDNYVLACRRCNEYVKRERFPVRGPLRACEDHSDPEAHEHRLLADPTRDPVETSFWVDMSDKLCPVSAPSSVTDATIRERTDETVKFFHLAADPDLIRPRVRARAEVIRVRDSNGSWEEIRHRAVRYHPDSMAWRDALRTFAPHVPLPTSDEELRWLLGNLEERLNLALGLIERGRNLEFWKARQRQILWTFAVLWAHPPTGRPEDVASWLAENALAPAVERFKAHLTRSR